MFAAFSTNVNLRTLIILIFGVDYLFRSQQLSDSNFTQQHPRSSASLHEMLDIAVAQVKNAFRDVSSHSVDHPLISRAQSVTMLSKVSPELSAAVNPSFGDHVVKVQLLPLLWVDDLHQCDPEFCRQFVQKLLNFGFPVIFTTSEPDGYEAVRNGIDTHAVFLSCDNPSVVFSCCFACLAQHPEFSRACNFQIFRP